MHEFSQKGAEKGKKSSQNVAENLSKTSNIDQFFYHVVYERPQRGYSNEYLSSGRKRSVCGI